MCNAILLPITHRNESVDDYSYTTPESGSMTSSDETTLLSTPQATPPASPSPTPSPQHTLMAEEQPGLATPTATPPLSIYEDIKESPLGTPQV